MTKLRNIAMVVVLGAALGASHAQAQDGGWNTKYGMLFAVPNLFQNGNSSVLNDLSGGVGLQYNLGAQRALRLEVSLSRQSDASYVSETTVTQPNGTSTTTKTFNAPTLEDANHNLASSIYGVDLAATYLVRLTTSALSPYLGAGAGIGFGQSSLNYTNDVNPQSVTKVDNVYRQFDVNAQGVLGVEWRVHKAVSLFAEYELGLTLWRYTSGSEDTSHTVPTGTTDTKSTASFSNFLNWGTGVGQGGKLGLVAYF